MTTEVFIAFLLFSISIAITPGAGNIALIGISSRYGLPATFPFVTGNALGIITVLAGSSAGIVSLFSVYPQLYTIMKLLGAAYLLFMAWGIATSEISDESADQKSGFMSGLMVQVLNPKGWIASLTVFSQFISPENDYVTQVTMITFIMVLTGVLGMLAWAYFGTMLKSVLRSPKKIVFINRCLGGSLALVVVFMLIQP